jgi:hypothetical protein
MPGVNPFKNSAGTLRKEICKARVYLVIFVSIYYALEKTSKE